MERTLAMILAGGRGKRMDILCQGRPKPALPFAGKFRVIDFSLSNCVHSGVHHVAVLTDYQRNSMADYLERWHHTNHPLESLDILEPKDGSYAGTADAVYQNLDYIDRHNPDIVVVLAGDHIYKMDYRKMVDFHVRSKADVTVSVIPVPIEHASRFGILATDSDGRVTDFLEKPKVPRSNLASMGICIFSRKVLAERLAQDAARADSPHDFGHSIMPIVVKHDRVFAYRFEGYWQDVGTTEAYYEANISLTHEPPSLRLNGNWPIFSERHDTLPERSHQGVIRNSIISPGCVVKGRVENSILSPGVWIEEQAVVRNSVLMANCFVGYHSVVEHCILDEGVDVGKFCYLGFRASSLSANRGITLVGRDVKIPPYTAVGRNCKIMPNVSPADFATRLVPSGTVFVPRASVPQEVP